MINCQRISIVLSLLVALTLGVYFAPLVGGAQSATVGLGVTGQFPMHLVAEQDVGQLSGYIRVVNDGGTLTGYYNISVEGQIAELTGWTVTVLPLTFTLPPETNTKVTVHIVCPNIVGEFTGGLRVSAYTEDGGGMGTGVAEIVVPMQIRLTPRGIITQPTEQGTFTIITRPTLFTSEYPAVIDSRPTASCLLVITAISDPCTITVEHLATLPPEVISPTTRFHVVGSYLKIAANTTLTLQATLKVYYDVDQVSQEGLEVDALQLYRWNGDWTVVPSQLNTTDHSFSAPITTFGYWAVMAPRSIPFYMQWWFWTPLVVTLICVVVLWQRRKR